MYRALFAGLLSGLSLVLLISCGGGGGSDPVTPEDPPVVPPVIDNPLPNSSYTFVNSSLIQFGTAGDDTAESIAYNDDDDSLYAVGSVTGASVWSYSVAPTTAAQRIYAGLGATDVPPSNALNGDAFLAKIDAATGSSLWLRQIDVSTDNGTEMDDDGYDVAVDSATGDAYLVGSNGEPYPFLVKMPFDGNYVRSASSRKVFNDLGFNGEAFAVALSSPYVFVAGYLDDAGAYKAFVARLNMADLTYPNSQAADVYTFPVVYGDSRILNLVVDAANERLLATGECDSAATGIDAYVADISYASAALTASVVLSNLPGDDYGHDIALDTATGDVTVVGKLNTVSGLVTGVLPQAGFMLRNLSANGVYDWVEELGSTLTDNLNSAWVLADGTVHAVGNTDGAVADLPAPSGAGGWSVVKDSLGDLGYGLFDPVTGGDEIYRSGAYSLTFSEHYILGETDGAVDVAFPNVGARDLFINTSTFSKN